MMQNKVIPDNIEAIGNFEREQNSQAGKYKAIKIMNIQWQQQK